MALEIQERFKAVLRKPTPDVVDSQASTPEPVLVPLADDLRNIRYVVERTRRILGAILERDELGVWGRLGV